MENAITWLLVADASKAKLYAMHKARFLREPHPKNITLLQDFTHLDSRKKTSELVSDKQGEFGSGSFEMNTPPKTHEANVFAHELMTHLEHGRKNGIYRDVILVAPPTFMGLLHSNTPIAMSKLITQKIEKDYTHDEGAHLIDKLMQHF